VYDGGLTSVSAAVASAEDAVAWAQQIPTAKYGKLSGCVEVMRLLLNPSFGEQLRELTHSD
jgi:hypothetical protein